MATFDVKTPDGKTFRVNAPDGATQDDAIRYVQAKFYANQAMSGQEVDRPDPTEGMSRTELFLAGMGKGMTDIARGIGQKLKLVSDKDIAEARALDAPLMERGFAKAGNMAGTAVSLAPTAFIPGANTLAGGVALGGATGFLQPSLSLEETAKNTLWGGAGGALAPVLSTGLRAGKALIDPLYEGGRNTIVGRSLRNAAEGQVDDVIRNLNTVQSRVPGVTYSTAEAAGSPGVSALQRAAVATDPVVVNRLTAQMSSNNAARVQALRDAAGDRDALAAAREAAADLLYAQANGKTLTLTPEIEALLKTPLGQKAIAEAKTLAANEMRPFSLKPSTPPQPSAILDANGNPVSMTPGRAGSMLTEDAHTIKRSLDDVIEGAAGKEGLAKNSRAAAIDVKDKFLGQVEAQVPEYGAARTTYAQMSKPVNQSDVLNAIVERATNNVEGNLTPAAFNRAATDRTAKSALKRTDATLDSVLSPQQKDLVASIKDDLLRLHGANTAGRGVGSDTVQKMAYTNMLDQAGVWNWARNFAPTSVAGNLFRQASNVAYSNANRQLSAKLAEAMMDPKVAAKLMSDAATRKGLLAFENGFRRAGNTVSQGLLAADPGQ